MVQRVRTHLEDDIHGGEAQHTIQFAVDGVHYEIDLNDHNAAELRKAFEHWTTHARKAPAPRGRARAAAAPRSHATRSKAELVAIREWARHHGHTVSDRGRIPARIIAEYEAAH